MSYDRVLPKPPALHYDPHHPRRSSNLLEHKIMNDDVSSKMSMLDRHMDALPVGGASACRYAPAPDTTLPQVHLSSLNRTKMAFNTKVAPNCPLSEASKPVAAPVSSKLPLRERNSVSERSSSASPVKATREPETQFCLCQPDPKIPRPRNAFILYRQHYQAAVVAQNPGLANPDISKIIGEQWRKLPQETKDEWKKLAEAEKARHQQQYPEYRYQPRRYGRDGSSRATSSGISHNPNGSSICSRCGGRVMNPPVSPEAPFTPNGSTSSSTGSSHSESSSSSRMHVPRSSDVEQRPPTHTHIKPAAPGENTRHRQWEDSGNRSPDSKRRRFNSHAVYKPTTTSSTTVHPRERTPESPYPITPYTPRPDVSAASRGGFHTFHMLQPPRGRNLHQVPPPDPSLKLPPLQTTAPLPPPTSNGAAVAPMTPFSQENHNQNVEATVMTIPFLNKIKLLAKISPPLAPLFREGPSPSHHRGAVIAVDGQDPLLVKTMVDYLNHVLQKEGKYYTRVFDGPEVRPRENTYSSDPSRMGHGTVDYINTISEWHRVSDEIVAFVKPSDSAAASEAAKSENGDENERSTPAVSPKTIIPRTEQMHISSPAQSSENGSVSGASSSSYTAGTGTTAATSTSTTSTTSSNLIPVALVPQYQLTTADSFACTVPLGDSYAPLDHWQWMAALWRGCVGPDITVYIRDCEKDEMERCGGGGQQQGANAVEVRLQDARTVVLRRAAGSGRELDEKALKRVGFEIEFFLTQ